MNDLSGNILATYTKEAGTPEIDEVPLYGTSRIGMAKFSGGSLQKCVYELGNHLGNVRVVVSRNISDPEQMDVLFATDYYPFGLEMPGRVYRSVQDEDYGYAYQGQFALKDKETGYNQFELRLYDKRLGRWLTTDPYGQYWSPFMAMGNNPMMYVDPDGGIDGENGFMGMQKFIENLSNYLSHIKADFINGTLISTELTASLNSISSGLSNFADIVFTIDNRPDYLKVTNHERIIITMNAIRKTNINEEDFFDLDKVFKNFPHIKTAGGKYFTEVTIGRTKMDVMMSIGCYTYYNKVGPAAHPMMKAIDHPINVHGKNGIKKAGRWRGIKYKQYTTRKGGNSPSQIEFQVRDGDDGSIHMNIFREYLDAGRWD